MSFDKLFERLKDLPIATVADSVTDSVMSGCITTLSSATGSGKTLYQTTHLASKCDGQVVVLVPRRYLAVNAAETIAELAECEIGSCVGYAVGSQSGDRSCWSPDTKLVFATNGYALASGLIQTATTFILDEVHETSMDLSIIRALLHRRVEQGDSIQVLEMSATMDIKHQSAYWAAIARTKIFQIDGRTFDCELRHRPAGRVEEEVMNLIEEGKRGVLVFRPGVGEVQDTAEEIVRLASVAGIQVEVAQIYGEMNYNERRVATATPAEGLVKVLVGTNVVESGANISWLDAGVSCGKGKENSVRQETGATYLELVDLPRWRLNQQEGRVKRFRPGIFVLCSPRSFEDRQQATRPEIERLALTELVMHCAGFGLRTDELVFDYAPDPRKVMEAELKLQRLGLVDQTCQLTKAGKFISGLPVGPETGAMLWHAHQIGCLEALLPVAAVIEVGGLRKNFRYSHYLDKTSDYLDAVLAFRLAYFARSRERKDVLEGNNISYKRFDAAADLLHDLERRFEIKANFDFDNLGHDLSQAILAGSLDKLLLPSGRNGQFSPVKNRFEAFAIGQGSVVYGRFGTKLVAGDLRVITPKDEWKSPFTVLEKVTSFELDDLKELAKIRPEILVETEERTEAFDTVQIRMVTKLFDEFIINQELVGSTRTYIESRSLFDEISNAQNMRRW